MARTNPSDRPISPHLQVYRPTITMLMSILHRITGIILTTGTIFLLVLLMALSSGESAYTCVQNIYGSLFGKIVIFGYVWVLLHHMLGGLRHLIWDTGVGFSKSERYSSAWLTILGSIFLTILVWLLYFFA